MGNCIYCLAEELKDGTESDTTSFDLSGPGEMVALDCKMYTQVLESTSLSSCLQSHTGVVTSGSPKHFQLEEDPEDRSTVEEVSAAGILDPPQGAEGGVSPPTAMAAAPSSQSYGGSISVQGEGSSSSESDSDTESVTSDVVDGKLAAMMQLLALKYLRKELITMAELLSAVKDYEEQFPVIFKEASECMQLVFGIEVKEVQPSSSYILVPVLGLTYDGMEGNDKGYPRTILLIIVLGIIYIQGSRAREEAIWGVLSEMGVYPGREHVVYGEPRKFLTEDLVQEQYLSYLKVPNSDPPRYEFLWGPRAQAETSRKDVLKFLSRLNAIALQIFPVCHEEDSEDED